ncbi:MAG: riboflavin synthase [Nitrosopumilaceae archaeon]|nr:riboflavin synthase [Nitrosopumilaceae archaeon]
MFTGIIEGTGKIDKITSSTNNRSAVQMTVDLGKRAKGLKIGQSVAINGVCLTATKLNKSKCIFEMIDETTKKTDLGNLKKGGIVNIERSLKAGDRLEGHFVLGHVDGVGIIKKIQKKPKEVQVWIEIPKKLTRYVVKKGSIAIDGISLTIVDVKKNQALVCLIPHTIDVTNFKTKKVGDKVNIETDILGKYILK